VRGEKLMKKILSFFMIIFITFTLVACKDKNVPTDKTEEIKEIKDVKVKTFENFDGEFVPLKSTVINTSFIKVKNDNDLCTYNGLGVFYDDVKSEIKVEELDGMTVRITVDDSSIDLYCESLESVCMVDLNTNDNFYELALYSTGPSMDPSIDFLHYDGVDIIPVTYDLESGLYGDVNADIDDVYPTFGPLWTDKKGRIITSLDNAAFTHTRIAFVYYVLDNHTFKKYDIEGIKLPYDSIISNDFTAYFTPCENEPDYFENEQDDYKIYYIVPNAQKNTMEPILISLKPGCESEKYGPFEGEEMGYILQGRVELVFGSQTYSLKKGQTFYFQADRLHYLKNTGKSEARILWVTTPPSF
jgi:quercetin dioxygenase-like cupin family protein